jgi:hypothetical protein
MKSNGAIFPVAIACMTFSLFSCGSHPKLNIPNRLRTFPVKGTVLVDGEPAGFVKVKFNPVTPLDTGGFQTNGVTMPDGRLVVSTYGLGDGAPAGEYVLTFSKREMHSDGSHGPDELNGRYESAQNSPHLIEIENSRHNEVDVELTTQ